MNLKKKILSLVLLPALFISSYGLAQNTKTHKVEPGETAYSIAKAYNMTLKELYALNPGVESGVKAGTELRLAQSAPTTTNSQSSKYRYHTIEKGETLYSVSRKYSVSMQDIMEANVGLTADTFQEDKVIRIPTGNIQKPEQEVNYLIHKVQKGETIYSIAQSYQITAESIRNANPGLKSELKKGTMLKIPQYSDKKITDKEVIAQEEKASALLRERAKINAVSNVKIGLLLPFLDKNEIQSNRFYEYMRGFLLAVEDFKKKGYSAEVYIFNSGTKTERLESLLETEDIRSLNVLIGGISQEQIEILADFAKKQKMRYVIPFNSKNDDVLSNDYVFQMNTSYKYLYEPIAQTFANKFKTSKIIFISDSENDKADFISALKSELQDNKILYTNVQLSQNTASELAALMSTNKQNIVVPTSSSLESFNKIYSILRTVEKDNPNIHDSMFGYPEWQTYGSQAQEKMHKMDTYFYASFFADNNQAAVKHFSERFKTKYGKKLMNVYPKFGLLGYDTGNYFLNAVKQFGVNFENHLNKYQDNSIQSALYFKRANTWGGFINRGFYLVHYGESSTEKTEYNK